MVYPFSRAATRWQIMLVTLLLIALLSALLLLSVSQSVVPVRNLIPSSFVATGATADGIAVPNLLKSRQAASE